MITATKHFTIRTPTGALTSVSVAFSTDEPASAAVADEVLARLARLSEQVIRERGNFIEHSYVTRAGYPANLKEGPLQ